MSIASGPSSDEKWTRGSFRVTSSELTSDEVSQELDIEPTDLDEHKAGRTIWILESGLSSSNTADEHIDALLTRLRPRAEALRGLKGHCDIFLGFASGNGQGGMVIPPRVLGELAALGIELVLDLYPPEQSGPDG